MSKNRVSNKQKTCKRRRVRKKSDGSLNQKDIEHNRKCEKKYMLIDNPWMKSVLNEKNPKGYNKYLKHLVTQRVSNLKKENKEKEAKQVKNIISLT